MDFVCTCVQPPRRPPGVCVRLALWYSQSRLSLLGFHVVCWSALAPSRTVTEGQRSCGLSLRLACQVDNLYRQCCHTGGSFTPCTKSGKLSLGAVGSGWEKPAPQFT